MIQSDIIIQSWSEIERMKDGGITDVNVLPDSIRLVFTCPKCPGKTFANKKALSNHNGMVHDERKHECPKCPDMVFSNKKSLYHHNNTVHDEKRLQCPKCDKKYSFQSQLTRHMRHHNHRCDICDEPFANYASLMKHNTAYHTEKKIYECGMCQKRFQQAETLREHKNNHVSLIACEICGKTFQYKRNFKQHMKISHEGRSFKCPHADCDAEYGYKKSLQRHLKKHESGNAVVSQRGPVRDDAIFECDVCKKRFTQEKSFLEHKQNHTENSSVKCPICGTSFAYNRNLVRHMRTTHDSILYRCTHDGCNAEYQYLASLKLHMKDHESVSSVPFHRASMVGRVRDRQSSIDSDRSKSDRSLIDLLAYDTLVKGPS